MSAHRSQSELDAPPRSSDDVLTLLRKYPFLHPPRLPDEIGRLGDYRVLQLLGQGGTAFVFLAEDLLLRRRVALKVMKPSLQGDPAANQRFLNEARTLASIKHDHVVAIYQVGHDNAANFLAMEWLRGWTLEEKIANDGPPDTAEMLRIAREIAAGLEAIHGNGLIHRDLKPNNIWVEEQGQIKLLDLGLVRSVDDDAGLTGSGFIVGTPAYMSPEQARGERIDARSDLFSLGGVLYFLGCGSLPFRSATSVGTLTCVILEQPPPIRERNPHLPEPLAALIMQLLEKKPLCRPGSVQEVIERLETMTTGRRSNEGEPAVTQVIDRVDCTAKTIVAPVAALERPRERRKLRRSLLTASVVLSIGLLFSAGWYFGAVESAGGSGGASGPPIDSAAGGAVPEPQVASSPKEEPVAKPGGILVLDDCDPQFKNKVQYHDQLTLLDLNGNKTFRLSGFNVCETVSSSRRIAVDRKRDSIWVIENSACRIRRFDLAGNLTLTIKCDSGSAIAVDAETGNLWALVSNIGIGSGRVVVYDRMGTVSATYPIPGWDIVYDGKAKAFWIASPNLTKISAASGDVLCSAQINGLSVASIDVDPESGAVWLAVRNLLDFGHFSHRLLKFDSEGRREVTIDLGTKSPCKVSVDRTDSSVWVAYRSKLLERFSAAGKSDTLLEVPVLAVQADPQGDGVWIVTHEETQKVTAQGVVAKRLRHAGKTGVAWIASLE